MPEIKRLNYFRTQFLEEGDFIDEQKYHRDMRHLHNKELHDWGIVSGLEVKKTDDQKISVSPGVAVDREGHEIVLSSDLGPREINLSDQDQFGRDVNVYIIIQYAEDKDEEDRRQLGAIDNYIRITERPKLNASKDSPADDGSVIVLASIELDTNANISKIDDLRRKYASSRIAPGAIADEQLAPEISNQITAATQFIANYDLGKRVLTSSITFDENSQSSAQISVPNLDFIPSLILVGGISRWTLSAQESYSAPISGFVNNQSILDQRCFCSGVTKTSPEKWLPVASEGRDLCDVTYTDQVEKKQSKLVVTASVSANAMTVQFRRSVPDGFDPIEQFEIRLSLLCLG